MLLTVHRRINCKILNSVMGRTAFMQANLMLNACYTDAVCIVIHSAAVVVTLDNRRIADDVDDDDVGLTDVWRRCHEIHPPPSVSRPPAANTTSKSSPARRKIRPRLRNGIAPCCKSPLPMNLCYATQCSAAHVVRDATDIEI